jgi:N-methylhydantoinase A
VAPPPPTGLRVGVDIGGTFTDITLAGPAGVLATGKTLTTPDEPARGVESAVRDALARTGLEASSLSQAVHGTTLVTNAILERKGATTALLATAGFRDVLELATEKRYDLYDLDLEPPAPLVPRRLCFGVSERIYADGSVAQELDREQVERLARELAEAGVQAVAVCFLHSFTNPEHELAARKAINEAAPALRVAVSSEVSLEIREYERATTTTASVYVQDVVERYLDDLSQRLAALGSRAPLHIMLSNGGTATAETAARHPIRLLESGPAGGAIAAAVYGAGRGQRDLLSFDMGGTTAKLCLIEDGRPFVTQAFEVDRKHRLQRGSGLPLQVSTIDMVEIGVGGGSIARTDTLGLLKTGPDSAGADPGPACYGRGGTLPTVTDADLVLGYLDPEYFLGGAMKLDLAAARAAIEQHVAGPLQLSVEEAAHGIHEIVDESMANAARVHTVERGKTPGSLPLFAFGGAGPVHAAGVARRLGSPLIIVPPAAGVLSTFGFLAAPLAFDFVRSRRVLLDDVGAQDADAVFEEMEEEGARLLAASGVRVSEITHRRSFDARHLGQGHEINVRVGGDAPWPGNAQAAFGEAYRTLYARPGPPVPVEIMRWRVESSGPAPPPPLVTDDGGTPRPAGARRLCIRGGEAAEVSVYDRYGLGSGAVVEGPALIEERESTSFVPPGARCTVGPDLALAIDLAGAR